MPNRDILAALNTEHLTLSKPIVIAGGTGFIGRALTRQLLDRGHAVTILTRTPRPRLDAAREIAWDGAHAGGWAAQIDGAEAIINLAGRSISCPHNPENLRAIAASRIQSAQAIAQAIRQVSTPPRTWVQASAVGYYGDTGDTLCDESSPAGHDLLADICQQWEAALTAAPLTATRPVILRIGFVLGRDGGALPVLQHLTRWFLGGAVGHGQQYLSWIHLADLADMFVQAIENPALTGPCNAVAPHPVTNAQFMRALRHALHRPWSPPAPALAVKFGALLLGTEGSLALISQRCTPKKFLAAGFPWQFPELPPALADLCRQ